MQSCVHAPKCNSEVDKNTDKFVICQGLNFITKIKTFIRLGQMKSRDKNPVCFSVEKSGGREDDRELKDQVCENSVEQNEPEMKSEEKSSGREDEIELKAQICENSMEQNEAEIKSEEKSTGREDDIELKAQICENSMELNEEEMKSEEKSSSREDEIELKAHLWKLDVTEWGRNKKWWEE